MPITCTVTRATTMETGVELSASNLNALGEPSVVVPSISLTDITLENFAVSALPSNGTTGRIIYVPDGDGGSPCLAVDNGSNWLRINLGSAVSTTDADEYLTSE